MQKFKKVGLETAFAEAWLLRDWGDARDIFAKGSYRRHKQEVTAAESVPGPVELREKLPTCRDTPPTAAKV